jgi:hypothetical protein
LSTITGAGAGLGVNTGSGVGTLFGTSLTGGSGLGEVSTGAAGFAGEAGGAGFFGAALRSVIGRFTSLRTFTSALAAAALCVKSNSTTVSYFSVAGIEPERNGNTQTPTTMDCKSSVKSMLLLLSLRLLIESFMMLVFDRWHFLLKTIDDFAKEPT